MLTAVRFETEVVEVPGNEPDGDYEQTSTEWVCRRCWATVSGQGDFRRRHLAWHAQLGK